MSNNNDYDNRIEHDGSENNTENPPGVHGGELKNGRKSQVKNHNPLSKNNPNEYINKKEQSIMDGSFEQN